MKTAASRSTPRNDALIELYVIPNPSTSLRAGSVRNLSKCIAADNQTPFLPRAAFRKIPRPSADGLGMTSFP